MANRVGPLSVQCRMRTSLFPLCVLLVGIIARNTISSRGRPGPRDTSATHNNDETRFYEPAKY